MRDLFPAMRSERHGDSDWLSWSGLIVFSFGALSGPALAYAGLLILLAAAIFNHRLTWASAYAAPAMYLYPLTFALIVLASLWNSIPLSDAWMGSHRDAAQNLLQLLVFPLVAVAVRGCERRVIFALGLFMAGYFSGRLLEADAADWRILLSGQRPSIDMTPLALSEYAAACAVSLAALAPWLWAVTRNRRVWRVCVVPVWVTLMSASLYITVIGRTRGVWLALLVLVAMAMAMLFWRQWLNKECGLVRWTPSMIVAVAAVLVITLAWPTIEARFASEGDTLAKLFRGDIAAVGGRSVGIRVQMWQFAFDHIGDRPMLGWGPGATEPLMRSSSNPAINAYDDVHSILFDLPLRIGLLGAATFGALTLWLLFVAGSRALSPGLSAWPALAVFLLLALHLLAGLTNFRMLNADWRFVWLLVAGLASGYALPYREEISR